MCISIQYFHFIYCAKWGACAGLTALGIVGPGGGYGQAAKVFNINQDTFIQIAKEDKNKGGVDSEDAKTLLDWANEYGVSVRGPEIHPNRSFGQNEHIHIGPVNHIAVK